MAIATVPRAPAPISTPITDTDRTGKLTGYVPTPWSDYFNSVDAQLASSYLVLEHQQINSGSGPIAVTPITGQILPGGLYRVSYYVVILQPATTSSSIAISIYWTDRTVTRVQTTPSLTGNAVGVALSNILLLRVDRATPVSYSVAYTSVGAAPMLYGLDLLLEQVIALK